jgi:uncharacterized protein
LFNPLGLEYAIVENEVAKSNARVGTDRPQRYAKQLISHMSRRATGEWDEDKNVGFIQFADARAALSCAEGALLIELTSSADGLERMEGVVGRHLVRFGTRDELVVQWNREDGTLGTEQRKEEE